VPLGQIESHPRSVLSHIKNLMNPYWPHGNQPPPPPPPPPPPFYLPPLPPTPPLPPIPDYYIPQSTSWWVWARIRVIGFIHGTFDAAYDMSNTEVVGHIRVVPNKPKEPVIVDLKYICPCFLRHGGQTPVCRSRSGVCNSTPNASEVCFENHEIVCICSISLSCIAADYLQCECSKVHLMTTCGVWHNGGNCDPRNCNHGHDVGGRTVRVDKIWEHGHHHPGY